MATGERVVTKPQLEEFAQNINRRLYQIKAEMGQPAAQGAAGAQGPQGPQGAQGYMGAQGYQGTQGDQGPQGVQGDPGPQGSMGPQGYQGYQGPAGPQGVQGSQGLMGEQGPIGPQGNQGAQGPTGAQGAQGSQGYMGEQGPVGSQGPATWTYVVTGNCIVVNQTQIKKDGGSSAWDSQAYSEQGYVHGVAVSFQAGQTDANAMMGLNSDPALDASYTSIDYAWFANYDGIAKIFESGAEIGNYGAYTTDTVFYIVYDGVNIKYYLDGVLKRTVARAVGDALYLDSSFHSPNAVIKMIAFGPSGGQGPQGQQGYQGPTGAQGVQGSQGYMGEQGPMGAQGYQGYQGPTGAQGAQGSQGYMGEQGPIGSQGAQGPTGPPDSLVLNPSFEYDGDWAVVEGSGSFSYSSADKTDGSRSLLTGAPTQAVGSKAIPVNPGDTYVVFIKLMGAAGAASGLYIRMQERSAYPDGGYVTSANRTSFTDLLANGAVPSSWTIYEYTYTVPSGIYWASFSIYNWTDGPSGGIYFDEVIVRKQFRTSYYEDDSIIASKISVTSLSAVQADMGTLTAGKIDVGNIEINADTERILMGAATEPMTGAGVFIGKDGSNYEFRCGDPAGNWLHWDGTDLKLWYDGDNDITAKEIEEGAARARQTITWDKVFKGSLWVGETGVKYGEPIYELKIFSAGGNNYYLGLSTDVEGGGEGTGESCFPGDAQILMENGKTKPIKDIKTGDRVLTRESETFSRLIPARVLRVYEHDEIEADSYLLINGFFRITPNHRILINGRWQRVENVKIGDEFITAENKKLAVESIERIKNINEKTYNLEIEEFKTYFADGIYVHNIKSPGE
jgi:hypothetical protein